MRRARAALAAVGLGLALLGAGPACGGEEDGVAPRPPAGEEAPDELREPGSGDERDEGGDGGEDGGEGEGQDGGGDSGSERGADGREAGYDPSLPDTEGNDVPPPPGSPAERFERTCKGNPSECD